jgi:hypothetical protein
MATGSPGEASRIKGRQSDDYEVHQEHEWTLTEAGQAAAAGFPHVNADVFFAPPKATSPEKLDQAHHRRHAKKGVRALTSSACRIHGKQVKRVGWNSLLDSVWLSGCRHELPDAVMEILLPHLEPFVDDDGRESLRITAAGIAATAKRVR